jgi:hypothetical protein
MMVHGPKRCAICSGVKSSRGLFLHRDLDARALLVNLESYLRGNRNAMLKFQPQN